MKLINLVHPETLNIFSSLVKQKLVLRHTKLVCELIDHIQKERNIAIKIEEQCKPDIDAGNEERKKEWSEYLNQEVEVKLLPSNILDPILDTCKEYTPDQFFILRTFLEKKDGAGVEEVKSAA